MSAQELDVRRSWGTIRRYRWVVLAIAMLGLAGGLVCAYLVPAMPTGKALVVLPPPTLDENGNTTQDIETQVLIANSAPVLASAAQSVEPPLSITDVKDRVRVVAATQEILEIRAQGTSKAQAKDLANAVADTYVFYVTDSGARLPKDLGKKVGARVLERATTTSGGEPVLHYLLYGGAGTGGAAVLGALGVLVVARGDRRLRLRDDIADAVGIPVLASLASRRPRKLSAWTELFERYQPSPVDAWSIRKALRHLGLDMRGSGAATLSVASFAGDGAALAVGPQLAVFASSIGVATELVVDARHESVAPLVAADPDLAQPDLRRSVADEPLRSGDAAGGDEVTLRVFVVVVDRAAPSLAGTQPAGSTVVAMSAGQATADDLARLAVAAADMDREIEGIVVADPDPSDRTTGTGPRRWARAVPHRPAPRRRATLTDVRGTRR